MHVLLLIVPIVAAGFNIMLALRLDDAGFNGVATKTIGWVPPISFFWTFAGSAVVNHLGLSKAIYFGLIFACYAAVLAALIHALKHRVFPGHFIWSISLTIPSLLSPVVWGIVSL